MTLDRTRRILVGLGALALAALVPFLLSATHLDSLANGGVLAVAILYAFGILSVIVLTGYVGQVSLCQATFMGISAFGTAALVNHGFNYFLAAAIGVMLSFSLGIIVGIPALRLRGILLAIVTVGVALSFDYYFYQDAAFEWFNGGLSGWKVAGVEVGPVLFDNLDFEHVIRIYWLLLAIFAVVCVLVVNLHDSGSGRRFRAIRESEVAAATMGVDLTRYKLLAFGISAAIAGIAGAFFPLVEGAVTFQPFSFFYSLQFAAIAVLVGIRFVPAAFVGGVFMSVLPEFLAHAQDIFHLPFEVKLVWFNMAVGLLLIVQMITLPEGVWGQWAEQTEHLLHQVANRPPPKAPTAKPKAAA